MRATRLSETIVVVAPIWSHNAIGKQHNTTQHNNEENNKTVSTKDRSHVLLQARCHA